MSEESNIDLMLGEINSPEQLRAVLDQVDDVSIVSVIKAFGVSEVLGKIFHTMTERFIADHAEGTNASILWKIDVDSEIFLYHVDIANGTCTSSEGDFPGARVAISLSLADFLRLVSGQLNPISAFTERKLVVQGDLTFAMSIQNMFVI